MLLLARIKVVCSRLSVSEVPTASEVDRPQCWFEDEAESTAREPIPLQQQETAAEQMQEPGQEQPVQDQLQEMSGCFATRPTSWFQFAEGIQDDRGNDVGVVDTLSKPPGI